MKRNNKKFRALSCLLAGCVVLTGAVFANIDNANGYTSYKNAIKKLVKLENYTADIKATAYIDDIPISIYGIEAKAEGDRVTSVITSERSIDDADKFKLGLSDVTRVSKHYINGEFDVYEHKSVNAIGSVIIHIENEEESAGNGKIYNPIIGESIDEEVLDKAIKFAETAADGFIGDIKNNFVYLGDENGEKHYNVTLAKEQMPNIVTSGLSLFCGIIQQENRYIGTDTDRVYNYDSAEDLIEMMFSNEKEPFIKSVSCDFKTDKNGNLKSNVINGTIAGYTEDGNEHTMSVKIEIEIRDIGTTVADKFDVYGVVGDTKMLDGTTKTFKEIIEAYNQITMFDGKKNIYVYNFRRDEVSSANNSSVYIINGREVSNTEYNEKSTERAAETVEVTVNEDFSVDTNAASVGIIGGADGPTAVYVAE